MGGYGVYQDLTRFRAYYFTKANVMLMKMASGLAVLLSVIAANSYGQTSAVTSDGFSTTPALSNKVAHFDLADATLLDAL